MGSELIMAAQSEAEQCVKIRLKAGAGGIPTVIVHYRVDERKAYPPTAMHLWCPPIIAKTHKLTYYTNTVFA